MYSFSNTSITRLNQCHPDLQLILNQAIKYIDFTVVTGYRSREEQNRLYAQGFSKLIYPNGKHNKLPSLAVDVAPYYKKYGGALFGGPEQVKRIMKQTNSSKQDVELFINKAYARLIGIFEGIALPHNIKLRVGLDWNGDFDTLDQTFHDLGHIELC